MTRRRATHAQRHRCALSQSLHETASSWLSVVAVDVVVVAAIVVTVDVVVVVAVVAVVDVAVACVRAGMHVGVLMLLLSVFFLFV